MKVVSSMGFKVFSDKLDEIALNGENKLLNTISPNSYGISVKDCEFRNALKASDYLVLDGVYFALSSIMLQGKNIVKNQGPEVFHYFMKRMNAMHGKVFFLGSDETTLNKIKRKAAQDFPNMHVSFFSPPYKKEFSADENKRMLQHINDFRPDILFVGMTCPKQEKWAYVHKKQIMASLTCCLGAVFDWYAGNQREIAPIWWKLRLAWLKRTIDRPEILKRYPNIGLFFWHLFLAIIGFKKYKHGNF